MLLEHVCTEPSPNRKFKVVGCGDANTARPGGGPGGGVHAVGLTATAMALGVKLMLPENRRFEVVPQGLPCVPRPPQTWTCSPAMIVLERPSGMATRRV